MPKLYRQGDFIFEEVDTVPNEAKGEKPKAGRLIVGYGEVTGHHHSFVAEREVAIKAFEGERFIVAEKPIAISHQEHATIELPIGLYRIVPQRQYERGEIERVID